MIARLAAVLSAAILCSCSSVEPAGLTKVIVDGGMDTDAAPKVPADTNHMPPPPKHDGPMRWQMRF